jgi:polyphosphate glucokinase
MSPSMPTALPSDILAIDIGGSHLKAGVLDDTGRVQGTPGRVPTPSPAAPDAVIASLKGRAGVILTAPNLGTELWEGIPLATMLQSTFSVPVRVLNDGTVQGLGVIAGDGLECVITLGTGLGFALFRDGDIMPHMEMGQHNAHGKHSYDHYLGQAAMEAAGRKRWNRRVRKTIDTLHTLLNYDTLYIGGGNATRIDFELPPNVHVVSNEAGITGGAKLWDPRLDTVFLRYG